MSPFDKAAPQGVLHYLKRFYFDTALSPDAPTLAALREFADPTHILFGSDFPFAPEPATALQTKALDESSLLEAEQRRALARDNALRLFPRLASTSETPGAVARAGRASIAQRAGRVLRAQFLALADRMRQR